MSVSGISSSSNQIESQFADRRQKFEALNDALQSGDLQSAQSAFAALQQSLPANTAAQGANNQFASDLQAVGKALQSGDLSGAQQAFATLKSHRHHGHHHHAASNVTGAVQTPSTTGPTSTSGVKTDVGNVVNAIA